MKGNTGVGSKYEYGFLNLCKMCGVPMPAREFRFHPERKWRFDFCWPAESVAVEIEGGIFVRGRHQSPMGFMRDMEKYNAASALGWHVIRIPAHELDPDHKKGRPVHWMEEIKGALEKRKG